MVLIDCKLSEAAAPDGEERILRRRQGAVWADQSCDLVFDLPEEGKNGRSDLILVHITPSELHDCKFRLSGEIEYSWLSDEGKTVEERHRVVRVPLPPSVSPGQRTKLRLKTETGAVYEFEFEVAEIR